MYGIVAAIGFHVGLMFFSFGIWMWSIPMLALLVWLLRETLASSDISVADVERGHDAEERAQTPAA